MIYLDHMATTPIAKPVLERMLAYMDSDGCYANPSSIQYTPGQQAAAAIATAQSQVAGLINAADPNSIVFTSGATEAINMALFGVALAYQHKGRHLITKACEHTAVLDCMSALQKQGFEVTILQPQANGLLDLDAFARAIRPDTILASLMWVNNEIGVQQDIAEIAAICQQRQVFLHVDAAQAAGKCAIDVSTIPIDLLSLSAHKFYGPKGVGCLYYRPEAHLHCQPILFGGGQQRRLRPGTLPTHQIVGLGAAAALAHQNLNPLRTHCQRLQDRAWQRIAALPGAIINGDQQHRVVHNVNFSLPGFNAFELSQQLAEHNICVATGSACHSQDLQPSHVLRALGCSVEIATAALRLSFGIDNTVEQIETTFDCIEQLIAVK